MRGGARERSLRAGRVKVRERVGVGGFGVADGSANLFYADLASPFDSPGYHCRGKSFFSISPPQTTTKLSVRGLCSRDWEGRGRENVTLKSWWFCIMPNTQPGRRSNYTVPRSSFFSFSFFLIPKRRQVVAAETVKSPLKKEKKKKKEWRV